VFGKGKRSGHLDPADYPHRVTVQTIAVEKNAFSEPNETPTNSFTTWAAFEPRVGEEWPDLGGNRLAGEKRQALSLALFRIPYGRAGITAAGHQIVYAGKTWDIRSVNVMPAGIPVEYHIEAQHIE
jgi:head-tail adaptor